jgi:nucleotide-binding universal stress UspA family protein
MSSTLAAFDRPEHVPSGLTGPIVVSVGENGVHVLRAAAVLAPLVQEQVHVYSAIEPQAVGVIGSEPTDFPADIEESRKESRVEHLSAGLAQVRSADHRWQLEVEHGDPVSGLLRRASELDAALVLIGIGRHRPMDRLFGGETTLRVIRHTSCPVLAVSGELQRRPRSVVVATDFSPQSMRAARTALPLLARGATLHVVHVWQPTSTDDPQVLGIEKMYARSITARLVRFVADLRTPPGVSVRTEVREGRGATQLIAYANEHRADLIVAGRRGPDTIAHAFVGSVTTSLLRGATCSVLVAPER